MWHLRLFSLLLGAFILGCPWLRGDELSRPVSLALPMPIMPADGATPLHAPLYVNLLDWKGRPAPARKEVKLQILAPCAAVQDQTVTIPQGQTSAPLDITTNGPAECTFRAQQVGDPASHLTAESQIISYARTGFRPHPPFSTLIRLFPAGKLRAALDTAKIVAVVLDRTKTPVPAPNDIAISFPGLSDLISPHPPLLIKAGSASGDASLQSAK